MSIATIALMENSFNVAYLLTVWVLALLMCLGWRRVSAGTKPEALGFCVTTLLLAFGDTFHVGARVLAALIGPERANVMLAGEPASLLGLGMLMTAYTMTGFYMVLGWVNLRHGQRRPDLAFWLVQILLGARLVIMAFPGNEWQLASPPYGMGLIRNLPLTIAGVILAVQYLSYGRRNKDTAWSGIGWAMVASYAFYLPVILFAKFVPLLGLLMIPKTVAYVLMVLVMYRRYWTRRQEPKFA